MAVYLLFLAIGMVGAMCPIDCLERLDRNVSSCLSDCGAPALRCWDEARVVCSKADCIVDRCERHCADICTT